MTGMYRLPAQSSV